MRTDLTGCQESLIASQNDDGGWGFHITSTSAVEPTAWALTALASVQTANPPHQSCQRARDWLRRAQLEDGSWPPFPGHPRGCWVTSVAARALHMLGGAEKSVERGREWIVNAWPAEGTLAWRIRQALFPSHLTRQDNSLRGWNWTPGTASWVEPTAQALLFIQTLPPQILPAQALKRRELGVRMLFDRMCPGGGWNAGNPLVYGVAGAPRVGPTAWALMALRPHSERPEVRASLSWLERVFGTIRGVASLALAYQCLKAYGRTLPPLAPALQELSSPTRFSENVLTLAWVTLALHEEEAMPTESKGKTEGP